MRGGRAFWQMFKRLTGTGNSSNSNVRLTMANGQLTSNTAPIADLFAAHLAAVHTTHQGPEFSAEMEATVHDYVRSHADVVAPNFNPQPEAGDDDLLVDVVEPNELLSALRQCKNRSAPGEDGVTYTILKQLPRCFLDRLADLY